MQVVVTRPEHEAKAWVQALSDAGHEVLALPLMAFESISPSVPDAAVVDVPSYTALMFVSAQAVAAYVKTYPDAISQARNARVDAHAQRPFPRYWAPGPGTARALMQTGIAADGIDQPDPQGQQFDSEALWQVVSSQVGAGARVLIVRGDTEGQAAAPNTASARQGHGRDWLAQQCEAAGAQVDYAVVYKRVRPVWTQAQQHQAREAVGQAVWLFSNAEALGHLAHLLPQTDWRYTAAVVTHPRVARAAQTLGLLNVTICRPHLAELLAAVARIDPGAPNGS